MNNGKMSLDPGIKGLFDIQWLQSLQNEFCKALGVYLFCLDSTGMQITQVETVDEDIAFLRSVITENEIRGIYSRVTESSLEDQAIEYSKVPGIWYGATSVKINNQAIVTWVMIGVMMDVETDAMYVDRVGQMQYHTETNKFEAALDLLRESTSHLMQIRMSGATAQAESRRSKFSEAEMSLTLKRVEAIRDIVQLLDCDDSIEIVLTKLLEHVGNYMSLDNCRVYKLSSERDDLVHIAAEWNSRGMVSPYEYTQNQKRLTYLNGDNVLVISSGSDCIKPDWKQDMAGLQQRALVSVPIFINGKARMYAVFSQCRRDRNWNVDDIRFMNDAVKIMQNIISKRIQQSSLAGSFASLEEILDNVGSSIYVRDKANQQILFVNRVLRNNFRKELDANDLGTLFESHIPENMDEGTLEIFDAASQHWYELTFTGITWMNGREANLFSVLEITEKKQYQKKIEQLAYTDYLTGLYNRMCCERDLAIYIDESKRSGKRGALLYLDLDDFKHINDGLGHKYGDVLLQSIAHSVNRIDGIKGTCYRMGGDEFVIIIAPDQYEKYDLIIQEIMNVFSRPWYLKDADYYCTMSMGVVHFPDEGDEVQSLIKKADITMYEAKKGGKNRLAVYHNDEETESSRRLEMETQMRAAAINGFEEFEVYYQPIIDIYENMPVCCGAEALLRWNNPKLGFISPAEFIPLAEYLELIIPIGEHVMFKACSACKWWNEHGKPDFKVNVNLSVVQLLQPNIVDVIARNLERTGIEPQHLTLEVTESLAINDMDKMTDVLNAIRKLGVRLALDDFGTGYSSLNYLRALPLDVIKVDQSFVKDLSVEPYSQAFVKMVNNLAQTLDMNVCVEGIETEEQYKVLEGMNTLVQGFFFDKPMKLDLFEEKYI